MKKDDDDYIEDKFKDIYIDENIDKSQLKNLTDVQLEHINLFDIDELDFGIDNQDKPSVEKDEKKRLKVRDDYFSYIDALIEDSEMNSISSNNTLLLIFVINILHLVDIIKCYNFESVYRKYAIEGLRYLRKYMRGVMLALRCGSNSGAYRNLIKMCKSYKIVKGSVKKLKLEKNPTFLLINKNVRYVVMRYKSVYSKIYNIDKIKKDVRTEVEDVNEGENELNILYGNYIHERK